MEVHIARFHNIFGPYGTWDGGREKAPAAMCRKVAEAHDGGEIEIWGDGEQTPAHFVHPANATHLLIRACKNVIYSRNVMRPKINPYQTTN
jgi:nucleoside-diphosphate-sugar epimerase